jgi:hypothetical protein
MPDSPIALKGQNILQQQDANALIETKKRGKQFRANASSWGWTSEEPSLSPHCGLFSVEQSYWNF